MAALLLHHGSPSLEPSPQRYGNSGKLDGGLSLARFRGRPMIIRNTWLFMDDFHVRKGPVIQRGTSSRRKRPLVHVNPAQ